MDESAAVLLLQVPEDLAGLLVAEGLADYHFQESRDALFVPTLIVAATSAIVTVAAQELTTKAIQRIGAVIAAWRSRRSTSVENEPAELALEVSTTTRITISMPLSTPESEVSAAIIEAMRQLQIDPNPARNGQSEA